MQLNTILLMAGWQAQALQLFMALSLLIILHEFGHFFFAKLFKTRVEKFYLFFDFLFPFSNILPFSLFKKTKGDTTYGIGWFPLGGYVKIAGMVDESMDKEQMAKPPQPWEYRSKKPWQRLFIMLGGIIVNVIVAIIIYIGVFKFWGERYLLVDNMTYGIAVDEVGKRAGLQNGDKIIALDGKPIHKTRDLARGILLHGATVIRVERNGQLTDIQVPKGTIRSMIKSKGAFLDARVPAVADSVNPGSLAAEMGLKHGDSIIAFNQEPVVFLDQLNERKAGMQAGQPVELTVLRNANDTLTLKGTLNKEKSFGFFNYTADHFFKYTEVHYGLGGAIAKGWKFTGEQFVDYWYQLKLIFTSPEVKASESVGGLASFASQFPKTFDWFSFWMFTAFISIILAFMNLLPIPGLDGGYVIFLIWEMITRRKVSDKVMEWATTVGLVLLLGLMLYANGLDIFRSLKK